MSGYRCVITKLYDFIMRIFKCSAAPNGAVVAAACVVCIGVGRGRGRPSRRFRRCHHALCVGVSKAMAKAYSSGAGPVASYACTAASSNATNGPHGGSSSSPGPGPGGVIMGDDQTWDRVYKCVYKVPVVFWQSQVWFFENPYRVAVFRFCKKMNRVTGVGT
jgi:hypothetical protein